MPHYMSRETLAKQLQIAPAAVDQYVKRGILPPAVPIGEALRWRWDTVDSWLQGRHSVDATTDDPYIAGAKRAAEAAPTRRQGHQQNRPAIPVSAQAPRNTPR
jgi:predicted DNA-binding transcriptional regulator AlpA